MEKILKNVEFDDAVFNIKDDYKQLTFPLVFKANSQCLLSERKTLAEGDVFTIHSRKNVGLLKGKDSQGKDLNIFTTCPHKVQLALPENERKFFNSLKELCEQESRPKFVEIKLEQEHESVKNGDRLKVLLVERGAKGPLFMHFRNDKGKHVRLPVEIEATFTACPPDGKEYFISEIANINKAPLALFIQFIPSSDNGNDFFTSLGIVEITEQTSVELLFVTFKDSGKYQCCVCPTPDNLVGNVAKGCIEKTESCQNISKMMTELVDIEKLEVLFGNMNPLEAGDFFQLPFDKVFSKKKFKDKDKRIQSLAVDSDDNYSDKEKKRSSFLAIFKDEKSKESNGSEKKEKKEKKKKKKLSDSNGKEDIESISKQSEKQGSESQGSKEDIITDEKKESAKADLANKDLENMDSVTESTEIKMKLETSDGDLIAESVNDGENTQTIEVSPRGKKAKSKEEKKKWKFFGHDKKDKKKKNSTEKSNSLENPKLAKHATLDSSTKPYESCSPCSDLEPNDYELQSELQMIAAQNAPPENYKEKDKPTLISRTWKKMKKRRRAFSASNIPRSNSDDVNEKSKKNDEKHEDSPPEVMEPDYPDEIYEQIPGDFMSQDIYEEAVRAYGAYETAVPKVSSADGMDSGFDENDQKALEKLREMSVPPPLPGNHPTMQTDPRPRRGSSLKDGKGNRISVDTEGFRRFYESMRTSEALIRSWGPDEIEKALVDLQLGHHADKFNESQIDGNLMIDLDEAVLRDLGLSRFEARKLRKFVFGWRPDSLRESVYQRKYSQTSKNPSEWSTEMVTDMITTELGIPEFAKFCQENQVNGDLLRDIVVDEELLNFLLTGKAMRLNAVKLKNYVLEGWRPPKKKEARCETVGNADLNENSNSETESRYEPLSPTTKLSKGHEETDVYEQPFFTPSTLKNENPEKESRDSGNSVTKKIELASPSAPTQDTKRKTSREHSKLVGSSSSGINSLMQKYEKKSSNVDAPRPFMKVTTSHSSSSGIGQRSVSNSPFVANMTKKFNNK